MPAPYWVRALLAIDRLFGRAIQLEAALRDELLLAYLPASRRDDVTGAIYANERVYVPGGAIFDRGLFSWERALLDHPAVPRSGRALVGAAGGGRELLALCERGYAVDAFEPSEPLARSCASVAARCVNARALRGSYRDLDAALQHQGPLAELRDRGPYALVMLGWRSLSHVLEAADRVALFAALARLAPGAPVIISFAPVSPSTRARTALRATFTRLRAPASAPRGAMFFPSAGFAVALDRGQIEAAAAGAGYSIAVFETNPEGFALLLPA